MTASKRWDDISVSILGIDQDCFERKKETWVDDGLSEESIALNKGASNRSTLIISNKPWHAGRTMLRLFFQAWTVMHRLSSTDKNVKRCLSKRAYFWRELDRLEHWEAIRLGQSARAEGGKTTRQSAPWTEEEANELAS